MNKPLKYNVIVQWISTQDEVEVTRLCNAVTIRNTGDTTLSVNGIVLLPSPGAGLSGESVAFGGNIGELYTGRIQIAFQGVIGVNPLAEITQKFYLE
jgi:hypothetical protein